MNTMALEADTRVQIDNNLQNLGWQLTGKNQNVFFERPRTEDELKRLKGKRPDYVLYSKETDKPVIVIETKRKGERIDKALTQGIGYAKALDASIVFATDGIFCKSYHAKFDKTPLLNGEEIDEFIREALAIKFLNNWEVNTISPKVQYDRKELIKIFDEANNMLRGEGLRAGIERFGEFANILFLKLISESEDIKAERGIKSEFNRMCHWDYIKELAPDSRIDHINKIVYEKLNKQYKTEIFTPLLIKDQTILKDIIDKLDPLKLTDINSDVKGDAFEYFLKESTASGNDLGEYFTPRHIVKAMVKIANPKIGEKIYDPFCGTGGLLIESFRHISNNMPRNDDTEKMLRENTIFGHEITNTARITKMNMILAGDGHSNIKMMDSLANPENGKYDVVLTNMPYSQKTKYGELYDVPSNNGDSICVQHCMKAINATSQNGRMAIVVPEGFLFRKDLAKTREYMLEKCDLQSIISLPQGVFLPYTGVKTNILYATKINQRHIKKHDSYWYFDVKSDGYTLDNYRRKLETGSDLDKYQEYRKLDGDQKQEMLNIGFKIIPLDKVINNSYVLVGSRYRENVIASYKFENFRLGDISTFIRGISFPKSAQKTSVADDYLKIVTTKAAQNNGIDFSNIICVDNSYIREEKLLNKDDILISLANSLPLVGRTTYVDNQYNNLSFGAFMGVIRANRLKVLPKFLYYLLQSDKVKEYYLSNAKTTTNISNLTFEDLSELVLPVPTLQIQNEIINELNGYQCIIAGARAVVESYKPFIKIKNNWKIFRIGELCDLATGSTPSTKDRDNYTGGDIKWLVSGDIHKGYIYDCDGRVTDKGKNSARLKMHKANSVLIALNGQGKTRGTVALLKTEATCNQSLVSMYPKDSNVILPEFLYYILKQMYQEIRDITGDKQRSGLNMILIREITIPVPTLEEQKSIIAQIKSEQKLIEPSKQLIEVFTKKIKNRIEELFE